MIKLQKYKVKETLLRNLYRNDTHGLTSCEERSKQCPSSIVGWLCSVTGLEGREWTEKWQPIWISSVRVRGSPLTCPCWKLRESTCNGKVVVVSERVMKERWGVVMTKEEGERVWDWHFGFGWSEWQLREERLFLLLLKLETWNLKSMAFVLFGKWERITSSISST